ncbi:lytic polysaccharide monooxygenase [Zopfia rhizophila CBS 207.26]|uniref:lytic cellulose monooxygenase (C4-dehydrogenating) n=1 Tax=Zopfia rhizophila CBS 207.26 TaxID=1314779 RepID=A0A6A6ER10_9PEZI|nr:lytic polysaccharide monooxygenase [Zopfia rhizophila CBS 207.26]
MATVNNTETKEFQYIRDVAPLYGYPAIAKIYPQIGLDIYGPNITCGRLAHLSSNTTSTATVPAGSELGFRLMNGGRILHEGPSQAYMAKAPEAMELETFVGDEEDAKWFEIESLTALNDTWWKTTGLRDVTFTIPKATRSGKYLVRVEAFWPHASVESAQWYVNCAHMEVVGGGNGVPTKFAKFPETYEISDPGIWITENQNGYPAKDLSKYVAPDPSVWTG